MSKWVDFVVSGIKKGPGLANITHVQVHEDFEGHLGNQKSLIRKPLPLISKREKHISQYIKKNETDWEPGEIINTYVLNGETHIRTDSNKVDGDRLGTLPEIES